MNDDELTDEQQRRFEVIRPHVRLSANGRPLVCEPSKFIRDQRIERGVPPVKPKIIFTSVESAQAAAQALFDQGLIREVQRAYACSRSSSGHAHLTGAPLKGTGS